MHLVKEVGEMVGKTTLCYIEKDDCYLMLYRNKKKEDINSAKWIGVGGHHLESETNEACLLREVKEETGLTLTDYELRAEIFFEADDLQEIIYLYTASAFEGTLIECDEGELMWIPKQKIFDLPLWEGDPIFLKKLLNGDPFFKMTLIYKQNKLITYRMEEEK